MVMAVGRNKQITKTYDFDALTPKNQASHSLLHGEVIKDEFLNVSGKRSTSIYTAGGQALYRAPALFRARLIDDAMRGVVLSPGTLAVLGCWGAAFLLNIMMKDERLKWRQNATNAFNADAARKNRGRLDAWSVDSTRDRFTAATVGSAPSVIGHTVDTAQSQVAALSQGLSCIAVLLTTNPLIAIGLGAALAASMGQQKYTKSSRQAAAKDEQNERDAMNAHMLSQADNVMLPNKYHNKVWERRRGEHVRAYQGALRETVETIQQSNVYVTAFHLLGLAGGLKLANVTNSPMEALISFPEIAGGVQGSMNYLTSRAEAECNDEKLKDVVTAAFPGEQAAFANRVDQIRFDQIHMVKNESATEPLEEQGRGRILGGLLRLPRRQQARQEQRQEQPQREDMRAMLSAPRAHVASGRYTIRGPNGAGKSTYVRALAIAMERAGISPIYLPTEHKLASEQGQTTSKGSAADKAEGGSSGQRAASHVEDLLNLTSPNMPLILDEWDAHMDAASIARFSGLLKEAARSRAVFEVRQAR